MASAIATRNKPPAEIYIGGAGDESSRLVFSYAEARRARIAVARLVYYLPHWKITAASNLVRELTEAGHPLALIGHSWGADTVLRAARAAGAALVIGADPVAKPVTRLTARDGRPAGAGLVMHVDAAPQAYDRSDLVKAAGFLAGGGVPRAFRSADVRIATALNHWNFRGMMQAAGSDGRSAEDWLEAFPGEVSRKAG
jgi:pimeloyl-ACP methyl ester carboxylesterase